MSRSVHPRSSATGMLDAIAVTPERAAGWMDESEPTCQEMDLSVRLGRLDRGAWRSFYLAHRRLVTAVLAASVGYGEGLDDVVQEVFVTAVRLVRSGRVRLQGDPAGLRAWLLAIARRVARTEARGRSRADARRTEYDWDAHGAAPVDPVLTQTLARARELVGRLPERLRTVWVLRHLEHMTIEEAARATDISPATVKRRLGRADERFLRLALRDPVVRDYLGLGGSR
jgi:RNA polymerase sigma-70 factor (ECF subfamily)